MAAFRGALTTDRRVLTLLYIFFSRRGHVLCFDDSEGGTGVGASTVAIGTDTEDEDDVHGVGARNAAVRSAASSLRNMHRRLPGLAENGPCSTSFMRRGVRPGDGIVREVAAFLLDHEGHAAVPPTGLVIARHSELYTSAAFRKAYVSAAPSVSGCASGGPTSRAASPEAAYSRPRSRISSLETMTPPRSAVRQGSCSAVVSNSSSPILSSLLEGVGAAFLSTIGNGATPAAAAAGAAGARTKMVAALSNGAACGRCGGERLQSASDAAAASLANATHKLWPPVKHCSIQAFVPHTCSAEEVSSSIWPIPEVHKIAIHDIRLVNTDRNDDNILARAWRKDDTNFSADASFNPSSDSTPSLVQYWERTLSERAGAGRELVALACNSPTGGCAAVETYALTLAHPRVSDRADASPMHTQPVKALDGATLSGTASGVLPRGGGLGPSAFTSVPPPHPPRAPQGSPRGTLPGIAIAITPRTSAGVPRADGGREVVGLSQFSELGGGVGSLSSVVVGVSSGAGTGNGSGSGSDANGAALAGGVSVGGAGAVVAAPNLGFVLGGGVATAGPPLGPLSPYVPPHKRSISALSDLGLTEEREGSRFVSFRAGGTADAALHSASAPPAALPPAALPLVALTADAQPHVDESCAPAITVQSPDVSPNDSPPLSSNSVMTVGGGSFSGNRMVGGVSGSSSTTGSPSSIAGRTSSFHDSGLLSGFGDDGVDVRALQNAARIELVPIDHGLSLPSVSHLEDVSFCWAYWRQCSAPLSAESKEFIRNLDGRADAELLRKTLGGPSLQPSALLTLRCSTALLQEGVEAGCVPLSRCTHPSLEHLTPQRLPPPPLFHTPQTDAFRDWPHDDARGWPRASRRWRC